MSLTLTEAAPHLAIVSRLAPEPKSPNCYLQLNGEGAPRWTSDPEAATAFPSMREATRAAARLPAAARAFGLLRHAELLAARDIH